LDDLAEYRWHARDATGNHLWSQHKIRIDTDGSRCEKVLSMQRI
jgi:hypothetical protein